MAAALAVAGALASCAGAARAQACTPSEASPARDAAGRSRHAGGARWYTNNEPITVHGARFVKYGLPRVVAAGLLEAVGEYDGVPVYVETGAAFSEVLYVPVGARCEVQPYQSMTGFHVVRAGPARPAGTPPALLDVTGCPRGADLYLFPSAELGSRPDWRAKLRHDSARYLGIAMAHRVVILTAEPRPYEVVLRWGGRAWRFPLVATPGHTVEVHARPPSLVSCTVPDYPVM